MSGPAPSEATAKPMLVISHSQLPAATPLDDTLLPCSPEQLLNTDVSAATLRDLDNHDRSLEEKAHGFANNKPLTSIYYQ